MHGVSVSKQEDAALISVGNELLYAVSQPTKHTVASPCPHNEQGQIELQAEGPEHCVPVHLQSTDYWNHLYRQRQFNGMQATGLLITPKIGVFAP